MQRVFLLISALFALYVSGFANATDAPQPAESSLAEPQMTEPQLPGSSSVESPLIEAPLTDPPLTEPLPRGNERPEPHIALLLPLKSSAFAPSAEAVQHGFMAAANLETGNPHLPGLPVRAYSCGDDGKDVVAQYLQAVASGARAVVGPLTRNGVAALAAEKDLAVPTLALNMLESQPGGPLYFFGMNMEAEARLAAQLAGQQGLHQAVVITTRPQLAKRLQFAFEEEWSGMHGSMLNEIEFNGDPAVFAGLAATPDTAVFLAADAANARLIRPYLPGGLPVYATSQIFVGNHDTLLNYDLNDIRFVDMPWLLQPDHPAVMVYPRSAPPLSADLERLYALGIDAFRLIRLMLDNRLGSSMPLDGVSGSIRLDGHIFQRTAIPAVFVEGQARLPGAEAAPAVPVFPALSENPQHE
jgi:outer membrane PBP1 activator LpoA protein